MLGRTVCWTSVLTLFFALGAYAELQNVEVGGSIEIWGNYYTPFYESGDPVIRIPSYLTQGRPLGPFGTESYIRAYHRKSADGCAWIEQRTTLSIKADFTEHVSAYIELDDIMDWGEDFRSADYITGRDIRADSSDDVEFYQAYIEADEMFGYPFRLRIGRQELIFGSEWLVGNNSYFCPPTYLSFDALRLTFAVEDWSVDAFASKLAERYVDHGDLDFYGLYATYSGIKEIAFDAYYFFLRDGEDVFDTEASWLTEKIEDWMGVDDYGNTAIHTIGVRGAGEWNGLDYELELAYQWGDASTLGQGFAVGLYGDDTARHNAFAGHCTLGYTLPVKFDPRLYASFTYYGGEDNRDISFKDWLNPFYKPKASVSFNRLFSSWEEDSFFDCGSLSNCWIATGGVEAAFTDSIEAGAYLQYLQVVSPFDPPMMKRIGSYKIPIGWPFPFLTESGSKDLGFITNLWASYAYSEDLSFEAGWSHLFTGDAIKKGAYVDYNGLGFMGGLEDDDADYFYIGSKLTF